MAGVFLSYARDDTPKARQVALALEKAGHNVWWDLHVRGGAQFAKVIEEALNAADVIVVLWSSSAIESPWVRDEAGVGRDTGRLVPVTIDGTPAPLGFRQFQTIDLSRWKGRGMPPALRSLLADIAAIVAADPGAASDEAAAPKTAVLDSAASRSRYLLAAIALVTIVVAGGLYWLFSGKGDRETTVAVAAADPAAGPLARALLLNLGNLRSVQGGSVRLLGQNDKVRADLTFEASTTGKGKAGTNISLLAGEQRDLLWSKEFGAGGVTPADLRLQISYTAEQVLGCAVEGLERGGKPLSAQTLKLYLTGCSQYSEAGDEGRASVIPVFEQVVKDAPHFKAAWAKLLVAESNALAADADRGRGRLQRFTAQARMLEPGMPEATFAEVTLLPTKAYGEALRLLDEANGRHPANALILNQRSHALANVGRMTEAIEDAKEAALLEPTSPDALNNYVRVLAYAGRIDAARAELQRAERLWPGTGLLQDLQWAFLLRFGDPKELLNSDQYKQGNPRLQMYFRTRADPTPANIDRFMAFLADLYSRRGLTAEDVVGHAQPYGEFGREDRLYELIFRLPADEDLSALSGVVFRPSLHKFRHDPRFMTVAKRLGLVDYWTKSGKWPDFCFDPDQPYDCKAESAKLS